MTDTPENATALAAVDRAIVRAVLPAAYQCIDDLLGAIGRGEAPSKELVVRCRRLLPRNYEHSFERGKA